MNKPTICNHAPSGNYKGQYMFVFIYDKGQYRGKVAPPIPSSNIVGWAG